jgi:hypothetical protein
LILSGIHYSNGKLDNTSAAHTFFSEWLLIIPESKCPSKKHPLLLALPHCSVEFLFLFPLPSTGAQLLTFTFYFLLSFSSV